MAAENKNNTVIKQVYDDTVFFVDSIINSYDAFSSILKMMKDGKATVELKKRYLLRAIDETWVSIIEDTLPSIEAVIRNPAKYIEEREEILPIELSHNITSRSLQHLSQHTNLISRIEGDTIIPSKILNVFKDETIQTYENKFVNTLINRLFAFVNRRYEIALSQGQDEKTTSIDFNENFEHGRLKGKMQFRIEISEPSDADDEDKADRNYTHSTDIWRRVKRLNSICTDYITSDFVAAMGKSYIRPPVMRTNAILKNKNLRKCLALWQFIETYDNAGYSMLVQEDLEKIDETYVKELYSTLALQYLIFRYNVNNEFEADNTLDSRITDDLINPQIVSELGQAEKGEYDIILDEKRIPIPTKGRYDTLTPEDRLILQSVEVALKADAILNADEYHPDLHPADIPEPEPNPTAAEPENDKIDDLDKNDGAESQTELIVPESKTRNVVKIDRAKYIKRSNRRYGPRRRKMYGCKNGKMQDIKNR